MKAYISLTCKAGAYNRVLKDLLDLNIPRGDIFLLFGPMDILVQFSNFKSLDEFKAKWFNPIRMIGAEEAIIAKTLTFIVISESPLFTEEPLTGTGLEHKVAIDSGATVVAKAGGRVTYVQADEVVVNNSSDVAYDIGMSMLQLVK